MKKTIRINISGYIFHIDDDAYKQLEKYLNSITVKFSATKDGKEIISDIEARVAELFQNQTNDEKEVININDVKNVIDIMGQPEEFDDIEVEQYDENPVDESKKKSKTGKKIFRDSDERLVGGVCSGIASYFDIDPIAVRIIFILTTLMYGTSAIIYIILWIIIPEAKTTTQKLEMYGKNVNISNIEKILRKELITVKKSFKKLRESGNYDKVVDLIKDSVDFFIKFLVGVLKAILVFFGIVFTLVGVFTLATFISSVFFSDSPISPLSWANTIITPSGILELISSPIDVRFILISISIVVSIPLLAIIYGGLKLIFRFESKNKATGIIMFIAWFFAFFSVIFLTLKTARNFKTNETVNKVYNIDNKLDDTLVLKIDDRYDKNIYSEIQLGDIRVNEDVSGIYMIGRVRMQVVKSINDNIEMTIKKHSHGRTTNDAVENSKKIIYDWQQQDSVISFASYFKLSDGEKWRNQETKILLKIPIGMKIYFSKGMEKLLRHVKNDQAYWGGEIIGQYWIMTNNGLSLIKSKSKTIENKNETMLDSNEMKIDSLEIKIENNELEKMKEEIKKM